MKTPTDLLRAPSWLAEFRAFVARGNVVDLAIGIIIGAAFTGIVNSLVKDVINPLIGVVIGGVDFSNVFFALNGEKYPTLDAAQKAGAPTLNIGLFINAVINFVIVAFVIFWLGKARSAADSPGSGETERAAGAVPNRRSARGNSRFVESAPGGYLGRQEQGATPYRLTRI